MATRRPFSKRIYSIASFKEAVSDAFAHLDDLQSARLSGRISHPFAERIMLAVTQVNGCRYCHYGHARAALRAGVSEVEIESLVAGRLEELPRDEVVALLFAQHYAETEGRPDSEAWQELVENYGPERARDIMAFIRMITIGNLLGNTLDAFLSRLVLRPAPYSSLGQELGVLLGVFIFIPAGLLRSKVASAGG